MSVLDCAEQSCIVAAEEQQTWKAAGVGTDSWLMSTEGLLAFEALDPIERGGGSLIGGTRSISSDVKGDAGDAAKEGEDGVSRSIARCSWSMAAVTSCEKLKLAALGSGVMVLVNAAQVDHVWT